VVAKDGAYRFAIPAGPSRTGTRERTVSVAGVRSRIQVNYCQLKDGPLLEVQMEALSGPGMRGVTVGDAINSVLDAERDDGFKVSEPKDVTVGEIKAKEYRLTKDTVTRRTVVFAVKPRIYLLNVAAEDAAQLDAETANTFLKSFVLVPAEVVKALAKEKAAKDEQAGKDNLEKFGAKWTTVLKDMTPPDAPVVGVIRGKEFKPEVVTLRGGALQFRQGVKGAFADVEVEVTLFPKAGESLENKTYEIAAAASNPGGSPFVKVATMAPGRRLPQSETFLNKYALKLTLGAKNADGDIPGTIYVCTPDSGKSFLAGAFLIKGK
jgi:hypothetical protein